MDIPRIGLVVGHSNAEHWSHVLQAPSVYGVIEVESTQGNAAIIGADIMRSLSNCPAEQLTDVFVLEQIDVLKGQGLVSLIVFIPHESTVHIIFSGSGRVYVYRNHQVSCLLKESGLLTGSLQRGDILIALSNNFIHTFSPETLHGNLGAGQADEIAEKLTLLLHTKQSDNAGALLLYQVPPEGTFHTPETFEASSVPVDRIGPRGVGMSKVLQMFPLRKRGRTDRHHISAATVRKPALMATALLGIVFVVSVALGIQRQMAAGKNTSLIAAMEQAQHSFDEGIALGDLNPVKSRQRLKEAKDTLAPFMNTISTRSKEERDAKVLFGKITDNLTQAMQTISAEPRLFYEVTLLKKDGTIGSIAAEGDSVAMVDGAVATVYMMTVSAKDGQIVGGGEGLANLRFVGFHGDILYVLSSDGIDRIDSKQKKLTKAIIKPDDGWGTISALLSFGGNIYLLDSQKSRIWKYVATDSGFSELREYLNPDTLPDLSRATGIAVDGSVWIGTTDGHILKFTQGHEDTFAPQGVDPPFGKALWVYTTDETKNLYVLDGDNKRVVVLDKDGMYLAQYLWLGNLHPTQFVVSEAQKKIILLIGGKLYTIDLK